MRLQLLSDLHLETERYSPVAAPDAELLVLAGDIDSSWAGLQRFRDWPRPVVFVAGNHEFDGRDFDEAWWALRERCAALSIRMLERESFIVTGADGRRIRLLGTIRWSDFDLFGAAGRPKAMRAGRYFMTLMGARRAGAPFDVDAMRLESLSCRQWLEGELARRRADWDATVVITHFAPSVRSADPRYGLQSGTASFCNADDDLITRADLWVHGHLHCVHDYRVSRGGATGRVVSNARGHATKGEGAGHRPQLVLDV